MKPVECPFEAETLSAVLQGRWPDRADAELRCHAAGCQICSDAAAIAGQIDEARERTRARAALPDSGRVWWTAQMRARREAAEAAGRPITAVQAVAFTCSIALLGACFGATSRWFQELLGKALAALADGRLIPVATAILAEHGALLLAMGALVLLVPALVYLTVLRD